MPATKTPRKYATIRAEAERLGVNPRTIRRRIADGSIKGYRFGDRLVRVDPAEVDAAMRRIPTAKAFRKGVSSTSKTG